MTRSSQLEQQIRQLPGIAQALLGESAGDDAVEAVLAVVASLLAVRGDDANVSAFRAWVTRGVS